MLCVGKVDEVRNYCLNKLLGVGGLHFHVQPRSGSNWGIGRTARNMRDGQKTNEQMDGRALEVILHAE